MRVGVAIRPRNIGAGVLLIALTGCSGGASPPATIPAPTTSLPGPTTTTGSSSTTTTSPAAGWERPQICRDCEAEIVATIPVGPEGITYLYVGVEEAQPVGPAAMAVSEAGGFAVVDTGGLGLVIVDDGVVSRASLDWPGIKSLVDVAWADTEVRILDFDALTLQPRLVEVDTAGQVALIHELPGSGADISLTGIAVGPGGQYWLEIEFGNRVGVLDPATGSYEEWAGYPYPEGLYGPVGTGDPFAPTIEFEAAGTSVTLEASEGNHVSARLIEVNPDGSFVLEKSDVGQDDQGVIRVTTTAVWFADDGTILGEAHLPLDGQFIYVSSPVAVGPDGYVYYLLTHPDRAQILRIPWKPPTQ